MLVLGFFTLALVPQAGTAASAISKVPVKTDRDPAPVNLAEFKNGYAAVVDPAFERPETWVTVCTGHMGDTFSLRGGSDALEGVFGYG
jgi:hypothetical protein